MSKIRQPPICRRSQHSASKATTRRAFSAWLIAHTSFLSRSLIRLSSHFVDIDARWLDNGDGGSFGFSTMCRFRLLWCSLSARRCRASLAVSLLHLMPCRIHFSAMPACPRLSRAGHATISRCYAAPLCFGRLCLAFHVSLLFRFSKLRLLFDR